MAKKKSTRKAAKATKKKAAAPKKKTGAAAKKKAKAGKKEPAKKQSGKKKAAARTVKKKRPSKSVSAILGRARVAATAELDQFFVKDYEARQVFTFLGVKSLKELETYSPDEIIEKLTGPMVQTVTRIRKALALQNRCLKGDQKFAAQVKQQMQAALKH